MLSVLCMWPAASYMSLKGTFNESNLCIYQQSPSTVLWSVSLWPFHISHSIFISSYGCGNALWMNNLQWDVSGKCVSQFWFSKCDFGNSPAHFAHLYAEKASAVCCVTFSRPGRHMGCKYWQVRGRPFSR